ncbi:MAG: hypothetical protein HY689_05670 [Chloroflexi bacterium]|nr:hypothetical protein [Chloroflexota bacterium]
MVPRHAYIILTTERIPMFEDETLQAPTFGNHRFFVIKVDPDIGYESFGGQGISVPAAQALAEAAAPVIQEHLEPPSHRRARAM